MKKHTAFLLLVLSASCTLFGGLPDDEPSHSKVARGQQDLPSPQPAKHCSATSSSQGNVTDNKHMLPVYPVSRHKASSNQKGPGLCDDCKAGFIYCQQDLYHPYRNGTPDDQCLCLWFCILPGIPEITEGRRSLLPRSDKLLTKCCYYSGYVEAAALGCLLNSTCLTCPLNCMYKTCKHVCKDAESRRCDS